jgi:hypothetical protein
MYIFSLTLTTRLHLGRQVPKKKINQIRGLRFILGAGGAGGRGAGGPGGGGGEAGGAGGIRFNF